MQVGGGAELQPAVGVRDGEAALDVVGDRLAGGVRQIVERQDDDVVADAAAAVLAAVALEAQLVLAAHVPILPAYQSWVFMFWTWPWWPLRKSPPALPP